MGGRHSKPPNEENREDQGSEAQPSSGPEVHCRVCKQEEETYKGDAEAATLPAFQLSPSKDPGKYYYGVRIVTGSQESAGTSNPHAYITLTGNKASSGKVDISNWLRVLKGTFDRRTFDDLIVESDTDLGVILVVGVGTEKDWLAKLGAPWYVEFVVVHNFDSSLNEEFPVYHWIGDKDYVTVTAHTTTEKDVANNPVLRKQREDQISKRQQTYRWLKFPDLGMPSGFDDGGKSSAIDAHVPSDQKFDRVKSIDFTANALKATIALGIEQSFMSLDSLHGYEELAVTMGAPDLELFQTNRWSSDVEFGRQVLNGVNPMMICKISALPDNFPVTNEMVQGSLHAGTLDQQLKAGRVYLCDMKVIDGLPFREGYYAGAPLCLLYVNGNDQLVPIAIQLKQQPGEDNPIFFPTDGRMDWLLAKIYYQSASLQYHQIVVHYSWCHAVMETYAMGTMRNLPDPHPIFKLLIPHFRYTMAINARARASLINDGGVIDTLFAIGGEGRRELMRQSATRYSIHCTNMKRSAKERGVDDPKTLPGYHYRDDGFELWNAMETYIRNVVDDFYKDNAAVKGDGELQKWALDLHTYGFPGYYGAEDGHDFPKKIDGKETLIELCTLIMFTGSAQHSAVNFGQYTYYGYIPNAPTGLRRPPPTKKGADYQDILDSLPGKSTSYKSISIAYALSQFSPDEIYIQKFPAERFTEPKVQRHIHRYQSTLDDITGDIDKRNETLDVPYRYLLPQRVPNSITI